MFGYVQLLRLKNCGMAVASVLIVALIATGLDLVTLPINAIVLASIVVFLFTGAGNTLNDYLDREIDRMNHPRRPIPRGRVSPGGALAMSGVLFGISVFLSLWLSIYCFLLVLVNLGIMLAYELKAKNAGLPGNMMISWLTASLFLFGGFAVEEMYPEVLEVVYILLLLSFFATLGREITKDIQDVRGDVGRNTLPKRIGTRRSGDVAGLCFAAAIGLSPLPFILEMFDIRYLIIILVADVMFIYTIRIIRRMPKIASGRAKMAMFVALAAFLLGGVL